MITALHLMVGTWICRHSDPSRTYLLLCVTDDKLIVSGSDVGWFRDDSDWRPLTDSELAAAKLRNRDYSHEASSDWASSNLDGHAGSVASLARERLYARVTELRRVRRDLIKQIIDVAANQLASGSWKDDGPVATPYELILESLSRTDGDLVAFSTEIAFYTNRISEIQSRHGTWLPVLALPNLKELRD